MALFFIYFSPTTVMIRYTYNGHERPYFPRERERERPRNNKFLSDFWHQGVNVQNVIHLQHLVDALIRSDLH